MTYDPNSIVDTLKQQGQDSSFASRAKLAAEAGITNYTGSTEQNTALIKLRQAPTVISSKPAQQAVQTAQDKLVNTQTTMTQNQTPTTEPAKPTAPSITVGGADAVDPMKDEIAKITSNAENEISAAESIFNNSLATLDKNTQATIQSIKDTYLRRKEQMDKANQTALSAKRVSGIVSGRERYAQDFQTNVLTEEETAGIKRIADLDAEERRLITEAENARDEKQMALLYQRMQEYSRIHKDKVDAINTLHKNAIDLEKLVIDKSQEQRQILKDNIDNMTKYADNIASSLIDSFTGDAKKDQALIDEAANQYGIDPNFISQAIAEYRLKEKQATPSDLREYDELVSRGQYSGSFFSYLKTKKSAEKVASGTSGTNSLTRDEATRYDLPEELIGKSDKDIIEDLLVSRVPDWFKVSQSRAGHIAPDAPLSEYQAQWNSFRNQDDIKVYTSTYDIIKAGAKDINSSQSDDEDSDLSTPTEFE